MSYSKQKHNTHILFDYLLFLLEQYFVFQYLKSQDKSFSLFSVAVCKLICIVLSVVSVSLKCECDQCSLILTNYFYKQVLFSNSRPIKSDSQTNVSNELTLCSESKAYNTTSVVRFANKWFYMKWFFLVSQNARRDQCSPICKKNLTHRLFVVNQKHTMWPM